MYPTISPLTGGFVNPPAAPGPSPFGAPLGASGSPSEGTSATSLLVMIAEPFRVAPPVPAPPRASLATSGSVQAAVRPAAASFDYERKVLDDLEGHRALATAPAENGLPQQQDRFEALLSQCVSNGCSREDAALGLAVALAVQRERAVDSHAVLEAARKVQQIRVMGFSSSVAAGALAARNGDLNAAIDMATA